MTDLEASMTWTTAERGCTRAQVEVPLTHVRPGEYMLPAELTS